MNHSCLFTVKKDDFLVQLTKLVTYLVKGEMISPNEIAILSGREPSAAESLLKDVRELAGIPLHRFRLRQQKGRTGLATPPQGSLLLSTIQAFKGLESRIAILVNLSEYQLPIDHPIMSSLFYVACTRACHMLYVFTCDGDTKTVACKKAAADIKSAGALVIDRHAVLHEFIGTVTWYDPQRVGWLSIAGQNLAKSKIMFFPHDVKKAKLDIKIGQKLRFTPKNEGHTVVASDLQTCKKDDTAA